MRTATRGAVRTPGRVTQQAHPFTPDAFIRPFGSFGKIECVHPLLHRTVSAKPRGTGPFQKGTLRALAFGQRADSRAASCSGGRQVGISWTMPFLRVSRQSPPPRNHPALSATARESAQRRMIPSQTTTPTARMARWWRLRPTTSSLTASMCSLRRPDPAFRPRENCKPVLRTRSFTRVHRATVALLVHTRFSNPRNNEASDYRSLASSSEKWRARKDSNLRPPSS